MSTVTHVQYFVPLDGDSEEHPNVFLVRKPQRSLTLGDIVQSFPLPGSYIFRAKAPFGKTYVWLDLNGDDDVPPTFNGKILLKAVRLSAAVNNQTAPTRVQPAAAASSSVPAGGQQARPAQARQPEPSPSPEARPPAVPARSAAAAPADAAPAAAHHDHDDPLGLFKGHKTSASSSSSSGVGASAAASSATSGADSASAPVPSSASSSSSSVPADIFSQPVARASPAPMAGGASSGAGTPAGSGFDAFWGMGGGVGGAQPSPMAGVSGGARPSTTLPLNQQQKASMPIGAIGARPLGTPTPVGAAGSNPANNASKGNLLSGNDIFNF